MVNVTTMKITITQDQLLGIVRHTLTFIGGILVWKGMIDSTMETQLIGSAVGLVGLVWSVLKNTPPPPDPPQTKSPVDVPSGE